MIKRALWQGLIAGTAGGAVMTLGEKIEQALTERPDSHVPARVLQRLTGVPEHPGKQPALAARGGPGPGQRHAAVHPGRPLPRRDAYGR